MGGAILSAAGTGASSLEWMRVISRLLERLPKVTRAKGQRDASVNVIHFSNVVLL
jgi:hypothetical protein